MAKSIWKRGERMTRQEKKKLRNLMPHPNRGRRLYQWKVECYRISRALTKGLDNRTISWDDIVNVPTADAVGDKPKSRIGEGCPTPAFEGIRDRTDAVEEAGDETYALPAHPGVVVGTTGSLLTDAQRDAILKAAKNRPGKPMSDAEWSAFEARLRGTPFSDLPPEMVEVLGDLWDLY